MKADFTQLRRYSSFRREIMFPETRNLSGESSDFLAALMTGIDEREISLDAGSSFWRAQIGIDIMKDDYRGTWVTSYRPDRMKPTSHFAKGNRASERGVPMLYLASDSDTAMRELRPWFGADLSVAEFKTNRPLRVADCIRKTKGSPLFIANDDSDTYRRRAAWGFVADAFSRPVQAGQDHEYKLTQHVAKALHERGFDGIAYKSICTERGTNLALFDLESADVVSLHVYQTKTVHCEFNVAGPSERV